MLFHFQMLSSLLFEEIRQSSTVVESQSGITFPFPTTHSSPKALFTIFHVGKMNPQHLTYALHFQNQAALHLAGLHLSPVHFLASIRELRAASVVGLNAALTLLSGQSRRVPKVPSTWMPRWTFSKIPGEVESNYFICTLLLTSFFSPLETCNIMTTVYSLQHALASQTGQVKLTSNVSVIFFHKGTERWKLSFLKLTPITFIFKTSYYKKISHQQNDSAQQLCKLKAYFRDRLCSMSNTTSLFRRNFISFAYNLQNKSFSLLRKTPREGRLWQLGMFSMLSKNSFHRSALASLQRNKNASK